MKSSSRAATVSILLPVYQCVRFVEEAIESALEQTYPNKEIILVDDGSTDGTREAALRYVERGVRVVLNPVNRGQYGNKNEAARHATGDLIKYLDGDDVLERDAVARLVGAWEQGGPGVGIVFGRMRVIDPEGRVIGQPQRWGFEGRADGRSVLRVVLSARLPGSRFGNTTPHLIARKAFDAVGGFPDDNAGPGDQEAFLKVLSLFDAAFVEEPVARYRVHPGSMSSKTFGARECADYVRMVRRVAPFLERQPGAPAELLRGDAVRRWMVWAGGHNILAAFQRMVLRRDPRYRELASVYEAEGLSGELRSFLRRSLVPYLARTARSKLRRRLGMPDAAPLFSGLDAELLRAGNRGPSDACPA